jgi:O-methyltransferase
MNEMVDMEAKFGQFYEMCKPYTMTSIERMYAIFKATEYICKNNIPGDFVECGVWKGGSSMMAALSLIHFGRTSKELWLYDTFEGMSEATDKDVSYRGELGKDYKEESWPTFNEVVNNMEKVGYTDGGIRLITGKVEDTIPKYSPMRISLLRLDTDWYESTLHELKHLYPLLIKGGVLIIDDYGHWEGARKATDEYFESIGVFPMLNRIDYTGRIMIKT